MNKFGLELVLKAHEEQIKTKGDKLVAILHWCLLHRGLRCSGKGENFAEETGGLSELLPLNWTQDQNVYALKYRQESNHPNKFIFKVMKDGDLANIFLLRMSDEATKNMNVDLSKDIVEDNVIATAFKELLDEFLPSQKQQPQQNVRPDSNKGIPNPTPSSARNPQIGPDHDPLRIGGSDLPFGWNGRGRYDDGPEKHAGYERRRKWKRHRTQFRSRISGNAQSLRRT